MENKSEQAKNGGAAQNKTREKERQRKRSNTQQSDNKITRFTFFPKSNKVKCKKTAKKKTNKKINNTEVRKRHCDKTNKKADDHKVKIRFFESQQQSIQKTTKKMTMRMPTWKETAHTVFRSSDDEESSLFTDRR